MNGRFKLKIPLDNSIDFLIEAFNFQGGQYKKIGSRMMKEFCNSFYVVPYKNEYAKFSEASSVKVPFGTCPFPTMDNLITNWMISDNGILPPYLPGGEKWRINVRFSKKDKVLGGYNLYGLIRNQETLMQGG